MTESVTSLPTKGLRTEKNVVKLTTSPASSSKKKLVLSPLSGQRIAKMKMPRVETYRGIGIHDYQNRDYIEREIKPAIDYIYEISSLMVLYEYACNVANPVEARLFAESKFMAMHEQRRSHSAKAWDLEFLRVRMCGLDSLDSADKWRVGFKFQVPPGPGQKDPRPKRPPEDQDRLEAAQDALRAEERRRRA